MPDGTTRAYFRCGPNEDNNKDPSKWGTIPDYTPLYKPSLGPDDNSPDYGWKFLNHGPPWSTSSDNQFRVGFATDEIGITDYDILNAGTFKFFANIPDASSENSDMDGYIGMNMGQSSYDRAWSPNIFRHQLHYETEWIRSGSNYFRRIGSTNYQYQGPLGASPPSSVREQKDGLFEIEISSSGQSMLANLLAGNYDGSGTSIYYRAKSHKVYWTARTQYYNRGYGFLKGGYIYPISLITSASGESVYSNATGWTVYGGDSPEQVLGDGFDETYVELEPGKKIVLKMSKPYISFSDFMETPNAKGNFMTREAYTYWMDEAYSNNYKYMELRFASVTHDGINTRMDWWYDKDATLPDSRLRNTSTDVDISECPITVFGPDGSPTGNTTEADWEQDSYGGLTVEQQSDHRVLIRNNSTTAGENVRISMARCRLGPGQFGAVNPSQSYFEFIPSFGS